ncbi:Oligoendopeptidase F homolog [Candidatus Zixiibacteriota bacterium]|nr:Oligoendopeptidase F homolog [candidate division Zixibacteria bacterium]
MFNHGKTAILYSFLISGVLFIMSDMQPAQAQVNAAPTRDQVDAKYKWKLEDLYPTDDAWEKVFNNLKSRLPEFKSFEGKLGGSPETLAECLALNDSLSMDFSRLINYAYLKKDEDNRVSHYQEMNDRVSALGSEFGSVSAFIEPEILAIPDDTLRSFLAREPRLAVYHFYLENLTRRKAHIMSTEVENLLAMSGNVTRGFGQIFSMVDDADIKYPPVKNEKGNLVELTKERYGVMLESTDRQVRKDASDAYNQAYFAYENTLGTTLSSSVNSDIFYARARKYNTALEANLDAYNIPKDVFMNLIDAVDKNLEPLHRYVTLRKKVLNLDTLYTYDMWVPLVPEAKMEFPKYEDAEALMLDALKPLGKEYLDNVKTALSSGWIDVYETQGKGSGGYTAPGAYTAHPYILLNYAGTLDNVFTLAHEMGHAMHTFYTNRNEPFIYSGHSLFTAEVASTCNEAIMIQYLIDRAKDKDQKLYLLNHFINQILGTFYAQVMFSEFELKIHEIVENGGALSAKTMRQIYRDIYQKYYGPDLVMEPDKDMGCLRISHFYRDYYVYQYATSYAASLLLSQKILTHEKGALDSYRTFISTGNSDYPINILKKAGIDMTSPVPVENVTRLFAGLVDQFEKLILEK